MKRIVLDTENPHVCCQCKGPVAGEGDKVVIGYGKMRKTLAPLAVMHPDCYRIWYDQSEAQAQSRATLAQAEKKAAWDALLQGRVTQWQHYRADSGF